MPLSTQHERGRPPLLTSRLLDAASPRQLRSMVGRAVRRHFGVPETDSALARVARIGFAPRTIVDVGANRGDFARACLRAWPTATVLCVEPLDACVAKLRAAATVDRRIRVHPVLVGAEERAAVLLHEADVASSVLVEHAPNAFPTSTHRMRTIDAIVAEHGQGCEFLKLDTQGYELEALRGAERTLPDVQLLLAEVNFLDLHREVPLVATLIAWLAERGFVAYDICGLMRRQLDGALWQADMMFVPEDSPLRRDKRWS